MRYSLAEGRVLAELGIRMDLVVVAGKAGKVENVAFRNSATDGNDLLADFKFFEIQAAAEGRCVCHKHSILLQVRFSVLPPANS
jgi:hypothetical protein